MSFMGTVQPVQQARKNGLKNDDDDEFISGAPAAGDCSPFAQPFPLEGRRREATTTLRPSSTTLNFIQFSPIPPPCCMKQETGIVEPVQVW